MTAPVIEVYFDPAGHVGGYDGCFRARLRDSHGCHSAGRIPEEAVRSLLLTIKSFQVVHGELFKGQEEYLGLPLAQEAYKIVRLAPWGGKPIPIDWTARDIQQEVFDVESQQIASSLVAYMIDKRHG